MERKVPFTEGEHFHLYSRGVEKRNIFTEPNDWERFLTLLFICNDAGGAIKTSNTMRNERGFPSLTAPEKTLTDILAYSLMPNHFHLIVRERNERGISKFMLKLMTAYSMYFNTKYERSGPLFTRPFRSRHIDSDEYFRWVFAYVVLNPLDLFQSNWKNEGISNNVEARKFLSEYRYGSFQDYPEPRRPEARILSLASLPTDVRPADLDDLLKKLSDSAVPHEENVFVTARHALV